LDGNPSEIQSHFKTATRLSGRRAGILPRPIRHNLTLPCIPLEGKIMKIVVIGGTGLIGSKLVKKLQEKGHDA
jgi:hypothetical protein